MSRLEKMIINPFKEEKDAQSGVRSQRIEDVDCTDDDAVRQALERYGKSFGSRYRKEKSYPSLTPLQIDAVLGQMRAQYAVEDLERWFTGDYLTRLMITSARRLNHYEFTLTTGDSSINALPDFYNKRGLKGLAINIAGNVGEESGKGMRHGTLAISGSAKIRLGCDARYSKITVKGDVGDRCGAEAIHCDITIEGDAGEYLGYSVACSTVTVYGDVEKMAFSGAVLSTFRTPQEKVFNEVISTPRLSRENKYQLINDKGKVVKTVIR